MIDTSQEFLDSIHLLHHAQAKKREAAAKRLRKLGIPEAGKPLLDALTKEVLDPRTWSSQYHMILALGFCRFEPALPLLWELATRDTEHTILFHGLGDAIVRISHKSVNDLEPVFELARTKRYELIQGGLRAMAMLRLVPDEEQIRKLIEIAEWPEAVKAVRGYPGDPCGLRQWVAAAAADWPRNLVRDFLARCLKIRDDNLQLAADKSLQGVYVKWGPY